MRHSAHPWVGPLHPHPLPRPISLFDVIFLELCSSACRSDPCPGWLQVTAPDPSGGCRGKVRGGLGGAGAPHRHWRTGGPRRGSDDGPDSQKPGEVLVTPHRPGATPGRGAGALRCPRPCRPGRECSTGWGAGPARRVRGTPPCPTGRKEGSPLTPLPHGQSAPGTAPPSGEGTSQGRSLSDLSPAPQESPSGAPGSLGTQHDT